MCLQWSCQIDATETNKPEFNLKCLGHATVSGNMKTLAIFAINYDQFEHSFHLCFTGWTVAPKCLFPLRPGFVKIMPSWAFFFFFLHCTLKIQQKQSRQNTSRLFFHSSVVPLPFTPVQLQQSTVSRKHTYIKKPENAVILVVCCRVMSLLNGTLHSGSNLRYAHSPVPPSATHCCQVIVLVPKQHQPVLTSMKLSIKH